jgi:membrane-bound serine protease (ClpP class)
VEPTVVILLIVGALLLALETVLPGLIAGIVGLGCLGTAVVMGYFNFGAKTGTLILAGVGAGLVAGTLAWFRYFPDSRFARVFVSQGSVGNVGAEKPELLDQTGTALTTLRPCGTALIKGKRVDVVSEGGLIEKDQAVKVVALEGMRVVVRPVDQV